MARNQGLSITSVVVLIASLIGLIAWCVFAAEYAGEYEGFKPKGFGIVRGRLTLLIEGIVAMFSAMGNGIQQIPNCFAVIRFTLSQRFGFFIAFLVVESLIVGGGVAMKRLEQQLNAPMKRR